jgi:P-type E1-E2 ATPase
VIEFNSTRKRMTVIVKDDSNRIRIMCKGADSIILPRLKSTALSVNETINYLDGYSKDGLRTLLIAEKEVTEEEYEAWSIEYN